VEIVAFSEHNQNWIREEIKKAVHPNGFKKVADRLRYWSLLGICVTAFLALVAMVITLGISTTNRISLRSTRSLGSRLPMRGTSWVS
jgi:hypothetical protein